MHLPHPHLSATCGLDLVIDPLLREQARPWAARHMVPEAHKTQGESMYESILDDFIKSLDGLDF